MEKLIDETLKRGSCEVEKFTDRFICSLSTYILRERRKFLIIYCKYITINL